MPSVPVRPNRRHRPGRPSGRRTIGTLSMIGTIAAGALTATALPSSAEVPANWLGVAHDSFTRTSGSGWGNASAGGAYAVSGSGSTTGTEGAVALSAGGTFTANLPKVVTTDVDVSDTFKLSTSASTYNVTSGWVGRHQADGSQYNVAVWVNQSGRATLNVSRVNGKTSTFLQGMTLPFAVKPGQSVRGNIQITGTSPVMVRARAWVAGSTRPWWQIQYSDSTSARIRAAGAVGVRNYIQTSSAAVRFLHDDLSVGSVTPLAAGTPTAPVPVTPPVAGAPAAVATGGRGTTLGSQSYPIPSGALFVDGKSGSDSNGGAQGSPLRTVSAAVSKAAAGKTIVVRAGTYHESITTSKVLTIQNYPRETVWFDGSVVVRNWVKSGTTWVSSGWTTDLDSSMGSSTTKARFIGNNPMAADPDQVFVNGAQLTQVGSASAVKAGTFAVNDAANTITIGTDPTAKEVRASNLGKAFALSGGNSVIQGIGVRRYATTYQVGAAVRLSSPGGTLRHMVITDNAMHGIALSNINKTVDRVVVTNNGQLGIGGTQLDNSVVKNSVVSGNNTQDFKDAPVSGGIKITQSRVITVSNNEVKNNKSAGIWFDASCYRTTAVNNDVQGNRSTQIQLEVSGTGLVANNTVTGGTTGILVYNTSDVKIYNNKIGDYSIFGIKLAQDARRQADASVREAHDSRRPIPDPTVTWVTKNVTVVNNVFGNSNHRGGFQFYALDGVTNRSADSMNITIDGNLFVKRINKLQTEPTMVAWGQGDNRTLVRYETPGEFRSKNASWVNAQAPNSYRIGEMGSFITQNAGIAKALPSDVAGATGLPAGSKKLGTY